MTQHTPKIRRGTQKFNRDQVWYLCSCGASGSACQTQAEALMAFQSHCDMTTEQERLEHVRAAAPDLLAALKEIGRHNAKAACQPESSWLAFLPKSAQDAIAKAEEGS